MTATIALDEKVTVLDHGAASATRLYARPDERTEAFAVTSLPRGFFNLSIAYCNRVDEGIMWIRGWHTWDSPDVRAARAAFALIGRDEVSLHRDRDELTWLERQ